MLKSDSNEPQRTSKLCFHTAEVAGSNPASPTIKYLQIVGIHLLYEHDLGTLCSNRAATQGSYYLDLFSRSLIEVALSNIAYQLADVAALPLVSWHYSVGLTRNWVGRAISAPQLSCCRTEVDVRDGPDLDHALDVRSRRGRRRSRVQVALRRAGRSASACRSLRRPRYGRTLGNRGVQGRRGVGCGERERWCLAACRIIQPVAYLCGTTISRIDFNA